MKIFKISNKAYDILVWIAQLGLPGLATLWATLSKVWGLPYGSEITETIVAIDLCLGTYLGISAHQYKKQLALDAGNEQ